MQRLIILLSLVILASTAEAQTQVTVNNLLKECVIIENQKIRTEKNLLLLDVELQWIKSTGDCGCKSAINSYTVREEPVENNIAVQHSWGKFVVLEKTKMITLPITALHNNSNYFLEIACAPPI